MAIRWRTGGQSSTRYHADAVAEVRGCIPPLTMSERVTITNISKPATVTPPAAMLHGDPCTLVIFGAVGDLARRKLMPAVYYLAKKKLLAEDFRIIGVGIESLTDAQYREEMKK